MKPVVENLFKDSSDSSGEENMKTVVEEGGVRVERIVSNGQSSPPGFWYDQAENEWVVLLRGRATLGFEDGDIVELRAGDHLLIKRHVRHRVEKTTDDALWLALHYGA